jgi:transcriptional regulator of stress and heat shock response
MSTEGQRKAKFTDSVIGGYALENLADLIEDHLLRLFTKESELSIRRSNLASEFRCAPSQITYVLMTRFTPARGYVVESRRGGGGFIRISRVEFDPESPFQEVEKSIGDALDSRTAEQHLEYLLDNDVISQREARVMTVALTMVLHPDPRVRDNLRALAFKQMLVALQRDRQRG